MASKELTELSVDLHIALDNDKTTGFIDSLDALCKKYAVNPKEFHNSRDKGTVRL